MMIIRWACFLVLLAPPLKAIPVSPTSPIDILGKVERWAWIDATASKSDGGGFLTSIKTVPTYYLILKVDGIPKEIRKSLSWYAGSQGRVAINHPITNVELADDEILILMDLDFIENLKKGAKIEIKGYTMQGDEWGCASDWKLARLDGKEITKGIRNADHPAPTDGGKPSK